MSIYFSRSLSPVSSADEVFNEDDAVDFFKVQSEKEQVQILNRESQTTSIVFSYVDGHKEQA